MGFSSKSFGSRWQFTAAVLTAAMTIAPRAAAQEEGFAINRFDVAEAGSDWFAGDSLDFRGSLRPGVRLAIDWAHKPLLRYDAEGDEIGAVVQDQVHGHAGLSLIIAERLRLGANLPVLISQGGDPISANGVTIEAAERAALGDLRIAADLRVAGEYGDPISLAIGVQFHTPTGDREAFAGDGTVRVVPRIMIAGDLAAFAYSLRAGFAYRPEDEGFGPVPTGSEVAFVATAGVRVADGHLLLGPELWGSTVVSESGAAFERETTPFELLFGGHFRAGGFQIGLGAGPGLNRGLGAPEVRVVGALTYVPEVPQDRDGDGIVDEEDACPDLPGPANRIRDLHGCPDRDGDEIIDPEDACPDTPGVRSDDPKKNGCPADRDGDGIPDSEDACPRVPGVPNEDPDKHGCPPDRDGDGILDEEDACPDEPGVRHPDPAKNGCPLPSDRDGDGIIDDVDACPDVPGVANEDPEKHGCPLARVEQDQIVITQRIEFEFDSAKLVPSSTPVLEAVLEILQEHPEITLVLVEGHTDNRGKPAYNEKLSDRRAAAVVQWLVEHGVDRARLHSAGIGMDRPIASNDDEVGRQKNRRVEFHIQQRGPQGEGDAEPDGGPDGASADEDDAEDEPPPPRPSPRPRPAPPEEEEEDEGEDPFDDPADW